VSSSSRCQPHTSDSTTYIYPDVFYQEDRFVDLLAVVLPLSMYAEQMDGCFFCAFGYERIEA
jgi:hypothetical protein